jgi:hypothetical protein
MALADVLPRPIGRLPKRLSQIAVLSGADAVILKNTSSSARVPLLAELFPQALFIHVLRDPHAVIRSLIKTDFWPAMTLWWCGLTVKELMERDGLTEEDVAAQHWSHQVKAANDALQRLPDRRHLQIWYEDFVADPLAQVHKLREHGISLGDDDALVEHVRDLAITPPSASSIASARVSAAVTHHCQTVLDSLTGS